MNARNVHAVIAAGVQHPNLLAKWQTEPDFLQRQGIAPETIDLAALRKFAGLTVKVRHNGLRFDLPLTFRLMSLAELDIVVFSAYATHCAATGHHYGKTSSERTRDLILFLEKWLDLNQRNHSLLWDMIRHEQALAQLKRSPGESSVDDFVNQGDSPRASRTLKGSSVLQVRGQIILHPMQCNPEAVRSALFERPLRLDQVPDETHFYGYWRVADEVRILDLDEFGYYALKLIDGTTPVAELNRRMGCGSRPTKAFIDALQQLAGVGILDLPNTTRLPAICTSSS
jgi:hypothetical protein